MEARQRTTSSDQGKPIEQLDNFNQARAIAQQHNLEEQIGASVLYSDNLGECPPDFPDEPEGNLLNSNEMMNNQSYIKRLGASVRGGNMTPSNISMNKAQRNANKLDVNLEPGCMTNSHLVELNIDS